MSDRESPSKRKRKYENSLSHISQEEAEKILGFKLKQFYYSQTLIERFITKTAPEELKKKVFERLIDCIESEGFPEATIAPMNESVVSDNVGTVLIAMVSYYKRTMHRNDLELSREKQIISKDERVGGNVEFIVTQEINVENNRYVLVVEAKRDSLGNGLKQLLLSLKCMWDVNNDQKMVYGFITTGINWQVVTYDGQTWKFSEPSTVLIGNMDGQEDRWLKNNTQILDVIYSILSSI
jgi:hypothetical protein